MFADYRMSKQQHAKTAKRLNRKVTGKHDVIQVRMNFVRFFCENFSHLTPFTSILKTQVNTGVLTPFLDPYGHARDGATHMHTNSCTINQFLYALQG